MSARIDVKSSVGTKYDQDKPRWHLLPMDCVEEVVKVLTFGANKYKENNWKKVKRGKVRYINAAYRHLAQINQGKYYDEETGLPHFAHAICSLIFAMWKWKHETKRSKSA